MTSYGTLADDIADRPADEATAPTEYVLASNGAFEVIHTDIADIIRPATRVQGLGVKMEPGVVLKLPLIPFTLLTQTLGFFKEVCRKHSNAEAFVRIWWNRRERRYEIQVPEQSVSGGGVHHRDDFDRDNSGDWLVAADIHSHNTMSAFWSGVDDADEKKAPEGRIHGVIGKVPSKLPEWKWRMRVRDGFIDMSLADVFEVPSKEPVPFTVSWKIILASLGKSDAMDSEGRLKLVCPVDAFGDLSFPAEWMEKVKGYSTGGSHVHSSWNGRGGGHGWQSPATGGSGASRFKGVQYLYILDPASGEAAEWEVMDGEVKKATGAKFRVADAMPSPDTRH
jgi:PRTRC genetic system protein A